MKTHIEEISAGKGEDIGVSYEISIDDEVVIEETEGDSLLSGFLGSLKSLMSGGLDDTVDAEKAWVLGGEDDQGFFSSDQLEAITSLGTVSASTISITHGDISPHNNIGTFRGAYILGVSGGSAGDINGSHFDAVAVSNDTTNISGSLAGGESIDNAYIMRVFDIADTEKGGEPHEHFTRPRIHVGSSSLDNVLDQVFLNDHIYHGNATGELDYKGQITNAPVIDLAQQISTITLTRDFSNLTDQSIPVREVGVMTKGERIDSGGFREIHTPLARDVVNTSVPSSSTISINYRIRTSADSDSGILVQFNEMLYRHFARTKRVAQDINNDDQDTDEANYTFYTPAPGGYSWPRNAKEQNFPSTRLGIQVGSSTQKVDEADFAVKSRIAHGASTSELFYLGQHMNELKEDGGTNKKFFDITRYFENRSPGSIDVEEAGLNVLGGQSESSNNDIHCIARARTGGISVATQEILKITYRVSIKID